MLDLRLKAERVVKKRARRMTSRFRKEFLAANLSCGRFFLLMCSRVVYIELNRAFTTASFDLT